MTCGRYSVFFSSRRRHTRLQGDWSSDVCSSDLLECHGEILTKDELIGRVWPDTVVEEGNLGRNISSLRKALDESPDEHRYIVTLARRGYRFVADVRERWEENGIATGPG